ncbi:MAG: T9SS type A sorting domain-containing protein [Hymenobacter sp.]|nr:MAG: T9SS type A sorting domain-containing protein [Hymenobacter sp.]
MPARQPACRRWQASLLLAAAAWAGASRPLAAQTLTNHGAYVLVQNGAALVVRGSLLNDAGSTLTSQGTTLLTGDLTNTGTLASAGKLVFAGAADQTFAPGGGSVAQLEARNTGNPGNNRVLLAQDLTLTGQLLLTQGLVRTGATTVLTLAAAATSGGQGETLGRYVQGNLRVVRDQVAGVVDFGNGLQLDATGSPLGTVTATRTAGLAAANLSYATNQAGGTAKGIDRIWTLTSTQAPTQAIPLTFSWTADDDNGLTDFSAAQVWQEQGSPAAWAAVMAPADGSARSLTTSVTSFSRWTVSNQANPLPVVLSRFVAERQGADVWLRWATATERNNDRFEVERSTDGQQFQQVATVRSQGTSSQATAYEHLDAQVASHQAPTLYYRLRQVDRDGTFTYSPVRAVAVGEPAGLRVQAYPNPFGATCTVAIEAPEAGPAALALCDALGQLVWQQNLVLTQGTQAYPLALPAQLPTGVYSLTVRQAAQQQRLTLTRF